MLRPAREASEVVSVVLLRKTGGSEVLVESRELAGVIADAINGKIVQRDDYWAIETKLPPKRVRCILRTLKIGDEPLQVYEVGLSRSKGKLVCPICGSSNIKLVGLSGWLTPPLYECKACGYVGRIVLEIE